MSHELTVRLINSQADMYIALVHDNDGFNTFFEYSYPPELIRIWEQIRETYPEDFGELFEQAHTDENGALIISDRGVPQTHSPFKFEDHTD